MNILKTITEVLLSLPIFAFASTASISNVDHMSLAGYGHKEIKICYQNKTKEIKSSQLQSFLNKGATLGKCLKEKKDDEKEDKKDDKKVKSNDDKTKVKNN